VNQSLNIKKEQFCTTHLSPRWTDPRCKKEKLKKLISKNPQQVAIYSNNLKTPTPSG
jgi:hypothetical protein